MLISQQIFATSAVFKMQSTLLQLFPLLYTLQCGLDPLKDYQENYSPHLRDGDEFDFIVVGAGSAGSVVANRLSEVHGWKILLLEAGGYPTVKSEIPGYSSQMSGGDTDWKYSTEPSPTACLSMPNGRCPMPRGKVLGGSSTINGLIYLRGAPEDYNIWSSMGNPGWDWTSVLPFFKKSQRVVGRTNPEYGTDGPLTTTYVKPPGIFRDLVLDSAREAGFTVHDDEAAFGYFEALVTTEDGERCSAAKAFLSKVKGRDNLFVATEAQVMQILITENEAVGVKVKVNNNVIDLRVRKEVVISAGVINSPQLLMLSGIGPRQHLESLGVPVVNALNTGYNYHDHFALLGVRVQIKLANESQLIDYDEYCLNRTGPLSDLGVLKIMGFISTVNDTKSSNIQIQQSLGAFNEEEQTYTIEYIIVLVDPKSRGRIELNSTDPFDPPLILGNFLNDANNEDIQALIDSVKHVKKTLQTPTMMNVQAKLIPTTLPACDSKTFDTEDYWDCIIRHGGISAWHNAGSCKMGPFTDPDAVVDPELRVYGIENLRVVDASIMPRVVKRNTNAPTIMIGEKGADMIKQHYLKC